MSIKYLFFAMLMLPVLGWGQMVDGKNLAEDNDILYLDIYHTMELTGALNKVIRVEYGQKVGGLELAGKVTGEDGKSIPFNSLIDALNKFSKWGWELVSTYTKDINGSSGELHAILKRKVIK